MDQISKYRERVAQKVGAMPNQSVQVGHSKRSPNLELPGKLSVSPDFCLSPIASSRGEEPAGFAQLLELPSPGLAAEETLKLPTDPTMSKYAGYGNVSMT